MDEVEAAEEEEDRIHGAMEEQAAAAPEPDPAQIAASMQVVNAFILEIMQRSDAYKFPVMSWVSFVNGRRILSEL